MNGIEKIIARIQSDSSKEIERINSLADAQCENIRSTYDSKARDTYNLMLTEAAKDAEARITRRGSMAALDAKKAVLDTKQKAVAETFDRAGQMIRELPDGEYAAFLAKLAADASSTGDEYIRLSEADARRCGSEVLRLANAALAEKGKNGALKLSDSYADINGGLILSAGDIEVNCSIDTLISQHKGSMASEVASALFD